MAQVDLKLDFFSGNPVVSLDDLSIAGLPRFVQGDALDLRIWIVQRSGGVATYLPTTDVTLFAALGDLLPAVPTYLTQQATWAANADLANPYFEALLPMNTPAINAALVGKRSITVDFGVNFYVSGSPTSALLKRVPIYKALITAGSTEVPAGQTPLSVEVANGLYLTHSVLGPVILRNAAGQAVSLSVGDDGEFAAARI